MTDRSPQRSSINLSASSRPLATTTTSSRFTLSTVHDTTDLDMVRETVAESFEDLKVRKPQPETRPTNFDGRYKRLVITPDNEYVVDGGTWTSPINGSPIVSSALISLRNDDWVTVKQGERFDAKGIAQLMASEVSKAINGS